MAVLEPSIHGLLEMLRERFEQKDIKLEEARNEIARMRDKANEAQNAFEKLEAAFAGFTGVPNSKDQFALLDALLASQGSGDKSPEEKYKLMEILVLSKIANELSKISQSIEVGLDIQRGK